MTLTARVGGVLRGEEWGRYPAIMHDGTTYASSEGGENVRR